MRIAFLGTPSPAVPSLRALASASDIDVEVVMTNPDRPRGRSRRPVPPPVKEAASELGLEVWQPQRPAELADDLAARRLDAAAVVAYGSILPPRVLATTRHGFVNLHFSLLPRWRGAAPVQHALRAGDPTTGLTTFVLDEGMDTGPILDRLEVEIEAEETAGELEARLAELGADLLVDSVRRLGEGAAPVAQPAEGATLARKVERDDVAIDWTARARDVVALVRSANPRPGAHTTHRGDDLKVWRARGAGDDEVAGIRSAGTQSVATRRAGEVGEIATDGPVVVAGDGAVVLTEVQPAGKRRMDGTSFVNGYRIEVGERLGGRA